MRIVVPVSSYRGLSARVASDIWEVRGLAVIDMGYAGNLEELMFVEVQDVLEDLSDIFFELEPDAVLASPLYPEIMTELLEEGITLLSGKYKTVGEVILAYLSGKLSPIFPWMQLDRPLN